MNDQELINRLKNCDPKIIEEFLEKLEKENKKWKDKNIGGVSIRKPKDMADMPVSWSCTEERYIAMFNR